MDFSKLKPHFEWALAEDLGDGDHSSLSCIPNTARGKARLLVKQEGVLAGVALAEFLFKTYAQNVDFHIYINDGEKVLPKQVAFETEAYIHDLLKLERLVLNYMQRLSGIATQSAVYAQAVAGTRAKVLDTRKTTPGLRNLEKWAVRLGGCYNHRMGLYDMIMLKDNHVDFAGGLTKAVQSARTYANQQGKTLPIEVEVRNLEELELALNGEGVDRIMLDNFSTENTKLAVNRVNGRVELESSGGITLDNIAEYAQCGVDYISIGALTHQIKSLDLSFKAF